jgi:hypothetical protein
MAMRPRLAAHSRPLDSRRNTRMLRVALAALLLAIGSLSALPTATAQRSVHVEPLRVLDDAPGDNDLLADGLHLPPGAFAAWDLRSLDVVDDDDTVTFAVGVEKVGDETANTEYRGVITLALDHGARKYSVRIYEVNEYSNAYYAQLWAWSEVTQSEFYVAYSPVSIQGNQLSATFAKIDLADEHGAAPFQGRSLLGLSALSRLTQGNIVLNEFDRMPDTGDAAYPIRGGLEQTGGIALWSLQPYRASNGEATTYVYTVEVENRGAAGDFHFEAEGVPAGWDVRFPETEVAVPAGPSQAHVLATVPFAHQHGTQPSFVVHLRGDDDGQRHGQMRLGVSYPKVAEPSGHHPDLYLHSQKYGGIDAVVWQQAKVWGKSWAWMSTQAPEEDEDDGQVAVPGRPDEESPTTSSFFWYAGTSLSVGLDFDLARPVELSLPIDTTLPLQAAQLNAFLYMGWRTGDGGWVTVPIARMTSEVQDLPAGSHLFQLEGLPLPEVDHVAPHKDMYMSWNFWLTATRPSADAARAYTPFVPTLDAAGASIHLPLVDYHDSVDEVYAALNGVRLFAAGPGSREVNPGETVVYNLTLHNGGEGAAFHFALRGEHAPWARLLTPESREVDAGAEVPVKLALSVPGGTPDGQAIDLLVEAHGPGGATALLRLGGQVVAGKDLPDDAALVPRLDEGRDSPAPAVGWLALAALALALAQRRRGAAE